MRKSLCLLVLCTLLFNLSLWADEPIKSSQTHLKPTPSLPFLKTVDNVAERLVARNSSDNFEFSTFYYDELGRVYMIKDSADYTVKDSIFYDEVGNIVKLSGYQLIDNIWKAVYYLLYEYDADGNMISRVNFNSQATTNWYQGGVYHYNYENGRKVSHRLYLGTSTDLYEFDTLYYDADGKLVEEIYYNYDFFDGTFLPTTRFTYEYDSLQRLIRYNGFYYYDENTWDPASSEIFKYDDYGNCIEHSVCSSSGSFTDRRFYEYDYSVPASNVVMPYGIPEQFYPEQFADQHKRISEEWYTLDDSYTLQYICDYEYIYEETNMVGVEEIEVAKVDVYPNPTQDVVTVQGENIAGWELYDLQGKKCLQSSVNATDNVNLSSYPQGVYILRITLQDGQVSTSKIVKQ